MQAEIFQFRLIQEIYVWFRTCPSQSKISIREKDVLGINMVEHSKDCITCNL